MNADLETIMSANLEFGHPLHHSPIVHPTPSKILFSVLIGLLFFAGLTATAQIPTTLTDKIFRGSGSINLLKDVSAASLQQYLTGNGQMILGVDVNEDAAGNESAQSVGVAIKQLQLAITTTAGTYSFGDFWTSTTANIREAGATTANQFYTLFGVAGSSQINGGKAGFDLRHFDDVVRINSVAFSGTLFSAHLNVTFLSTAKTSTQGNETFFDFSGGFEDFAMIGNPEAYALEAAGAGLAAAPSGITYTAQTVPSPTTTTVPAPTPTTTTPTAPGAPAPPFVLLAGLGALVVWKSRGRHAIA